MLWVLPIFLCHGGVVKQSLVNWIVQSFGSCPFYTRLLDWVLPLSMILNLSKVTERWVSNRFLLPLALMVPNGSVQDLSLQPNLELLATCILLEKVHMQPFCWH